MKLKKKHMLLYAVTDSAWVGKQSLYEQVEAALKGGVTCVQLREKQLDKDAFLKEAISIGELCRSYNVPFIVNDDLDIALKSGADGVHVGQSDMNAAEIRRIAGKELIIGVSAKTVEQAVEAQKNGADYLGVGAAFATSTKADASVVSHKVYREITSAVDIPVVAIGGISRDNILSLKGSGISGCALVSAVFAAEDIESECRLLRRLCEEASEKDF